MKISEYISLPAGKKGKMMKAAAKLANRDQKLVVERSKRVRVSSVGLRKS